MKPKHCAALLALMGLLALVHQAALSWLSGHDIMSCLMSPGAHVPVGALVFSLCFLVLRMAVILLFPGLAVVLLALAAAGVVERRINRDGEKG
jgi:hypothetical protein